MQHDPEDHDEQYAGEQSDRDELPSSVPRVESFHRRTPDGRSFLDIEID
ncbi:MAG TPA: hypothetical protein VIC35_01280 [Acidimicrobiia bacterium]|jgi:hypothetical protein